MANEKYLDEQLDIFLEEVKKIVPAMSDFLIGRGNPDKPGFNITKRKKEEKYSAKYVVYLCPFQEVFIVWDLKRHLNSDGAKNNLSVGKSWNEIEPNSSFFKPYYKKLGTKKDSLFEKVYVVGISNLELFFLNYKELMLFNEFDIEFPAIDQELIGNEIKWLDADERKKYSSIQKRRDTKFRKEVLEAYDTRCAICRCSIEEIIQAAHEKGHEVANTSFDDSLHGICLCANHHLMYDKNLIDINLQDLTITIRDDRIKEMAWYEVFMKKYDGHILKRKILN